jgi:hypothetical protein
VQRSVVPGLTATGNSRLMAFPKIGFGVVKNCVKLISLTSLSTLSCRIKRNMSERVGDNSGSQTEGGDSHLGVLYFV